MKFDSTRAAGSTKLSNSASSPPLAATKAAVRASPVDWYVKVEQSGRDSGVLWQGRCYVMTVWGK